MQREGDNWPPDHTLVDVDAPGGEHIRNHKGVAEALQHNIVVVLAK